MERYRDLEIIKKLKDEGDMTLEEFETEKQKILSRQEEDTQKGMGTYAACVILGICSLLFSFMSIVNAYSLYMSIISGITAIVLGIIARKKLKEKKEKNRMITTGIITGVLGTIFSVTIIAMVIYSVIKIGSISINNATNNNTNTNTNTSITTKINNDDDTDTDNTNEN